MGAASRGRAIVSAITTSEVLTDECSAEVVVVRGRERLSKRVERLATFRQLTDAEAGRLLGDTETRSLSAPVEWEIARQDNGAPTEVRFSVPVFTSASEELALKGRIALVRPDVSHWLLTWGDKSRSQRPEVLRRLDVGDTHRQPDGEVWERRTHKHLWSTSEGNSWAYLPTDIPETPAGQTVSGADYRQVFEAFVAECKIDIGPDYKWTDPPLTTEQLALPNWEVP